MFEDVIKPSWAKRDDPHVCLANFRDLKKPQDVAEFIDLCGAESPRGRRLGPGYLGAMRAILRAIQGRMRRAFEGDPLAFYEDKRSRSFTPVKNLYCVWQKTQYAAAPYGLDDYVTLLTMRDVESGRAKKCKYKYCRAPYFVAPKRNDSKYCRRAHAVAAGVGRFRAK